jgi:hypothetical protein
MLVFAAYRVLQKCVKTKLKPGLSSKPAQNMLKTLFLRDEHNTMQCHQHRFFLWIL